MREHDGGVKTGSILTIVAAIAAVAIAEEEAAQRELARQSRELRERTDLLAEAMAEVFADDDDEHVELPVAEHRPDG